MGRVTIDVSEVLVSSRLRVGRGTSAKVAELHALPVCDAAIFEEWKADKGNADLWAIVNLSSIVYEPDYDATIRAMLAGLDAKAATDADETTREQAKAYAFSVRQDALLQYRTKFSNPANSAGLSDPDGGRFSVNMARASDYRSGGYVVVTHVAEAMTRRAGRSGAKTIERMAAGAATWLASVSTATEPTDSE